MSNLWDDVLNNCKKAERKYEDWRMPVTDASFVITNAKIAIKNGHPAPKRIIVNGPATIVFWTDGTKTVVKCQKGDIYNPEVGIAMCFMKKCSGNKFRKYMKMMYEACSDSLTLNAKNG